MQQLKNLVGGEWVEQHGAGARRIVDPADGETVIAEFAESTEDDVARAVAAAQDAFPSWRNTPVVRRCRLLLHIKELLEEQAGEIAEIIVAENGKLLSEAEGELRRGLEVLEFAAGMPSLAKGDFIEDIATRVDGYVYREPVGVAAGICPFNFPAMIPMWMFPVALACGNTFVLKPSEKCPVSATRIAEIFTEGGLPDGVLNVVHGGRATAEALISSPDVAAVSFVGSTPAARNVFLQGTRHHKRVQALGGAKNYLLVLADAHPEKTVQAVVHSAYGCAGQRCMAASILLLVGEDAEPFLEQVLEAARELRLGRGLDPSTGMGPVIDAAGKERVERYIESAASEGAEILLDGRGAEVPELPGGFFVGPTVIDKVRPEMKVAGEEIFGPVLCVMRAKDLDEALDLVNSSSYGNGASIFTSSGGAAREFRNRVECGMIGINAGVPAPMAFFPFGGFKNSFFGDLKAQGPDSIEFYTRKKAVIERWLGGGPTGNIWGK